MLRVALRESLILLAATAISWFTLRMNPFVGFDTRFLGLILPFIYCLVRLSILKYPPREFSWLRRAGFQIAMGIALVCLLLFEEMIALMPGDKNGWEVWTILACFGAGYVLCFCVADALRRSPWEHAVREQNASVPAWDPSTWGLEDGKQDPLDPPQQFRI